MFFLKNQLVDIDEQLFLLRDEEKRYSAAFGKLIATFRVEDWLHKLENFVWLFGVSLLVSRQTVTRVTLDLPKCKEPWKNKK